MLRFTRFHRLQYVRKCRRNDTKRSSVELLECMVSYICVQSRIVHPVILQLIYQICVYLQSVHKKVALIFFAFLNWSPEQEQCNHWLHLTHFTIPDERFLSTLHILQISLSSVTVSSIERLHDDWIFAKNLYIHIYIYLHCI